MSKRVPPAVRPSPGSLSLPRRTRAFLAPRPFSAVAATTAAMFRTHPPSPRSPPGIVVCVRGLPRSSRPAYRAETTSPRSPRNRPGRTTIPRRYPGGAHARLLPSCWGRSQVERSWVLLSTPRLRLPTLPCDWWLSQPTPFSIGRAAVALPAGESPTPTSSREEGLEFRVVAQS